MSGYRSQPPAPPRPPTPPSSHPTPPQPPAPPTPARPNPPAPDPFPPATTSMASIWGHFGNLFNSKDDAVMGDLSQHLKCTVSDQKNNFIPLAPTLQFIIPLTGRQMTMTHGTDRPFQEAVCCGNDDVSFYGGNDNFILYDGGNDDGSDNGNDDDTEDPDL
jgi:hypothetical protein